MPTTRAPLRAHLCGSPRLSSVSPGSEFRDAVFDYDRCCLQFDYLHTIVYML